MRGLQVCKATRGLLAVANCGKLSPRGTTGSRSLCPVAGSCSVNIGLDFWCVGDKGCRGG